MIEWYAVDLDCTTGQVIKHEIVSRSASSDAEECEAICGGAPIHGTPFRWLSRLSYDHAEALCRVDFEACKVQGRTVMANYRTEESAP